MKKRNYHRARVVDSTMTELIIFLLFVFFLFVAAKTNDYEILLGDYTKEMTAKDEVFEELTEQRSDAESMEGELERLERFCAKLRKELEEMARAGSVAGYSLDRVPDRELARRIDRIAACLGGMSSVIEGLEPKLESLSRELEAKTGEGPPSCLSTQVGSIVPLFNIEIHEGSLKVSRRMVQEDDLNSKLAAAEKELAWPPGPSTMSLQIFKRTAQRIYDYTTSTSNAFGGNCRIYINIRFTYPGDSAEHRDRAHRMLRTIERYFFIGNWPEVDEYFGI